jgi:hypothetical protein
MKWSIEIGKDSFMPHNHHFYWSATLADHDASLVGTRPYARKDSAKRAAIRTVRKLLKPGDRWEVVEV